MSYLCLSITDSQGALYQALSATARRRGNNISYNCSVVRTVSVHICACIPVTGTDCSSNFLVFYVIMPPFPEQTSPTFALEYFHYFPMAFYSMSLGRFAEPSWKKHSSSRLGHTLGTLPICRQPDEQYRVSQTNQHSPCYYHGDSQL